MVRYSEWIWSEEHKKHYCAVYDDDGQITEYQWEGGYRQAVQEPADTHSSASPTQSHRQTRVDSGSYTQSSYPYTSSQSAYTNAYQNTTSSYNPYGQSSHNTYTTSSQYSSGGHGQLPESIQQTVGGNKVNRHLKTGVDGLEYERLHPSFKRVTARDQEAFFSRGRVFKMLWTEPAGMANPGKTRGSTHYSVVRFQEGAYSEIRRFVVIQNKGTFSQCIPVQTYRGQGATKHGLIVGDHAMIYTGSRLDRPPRPFGGEEAMNKQAIRVNPIGGETLDGASRINFGKPYAVEHNVKLAEIGQVCSEHEHLLVTYFMEAMGLNT